MVLTAQVRLTKETYAQRLTMGGIPTVKKTDGAKLTFEYTEPKQFCWLTVGSAILVTARRAIATPAVPFKTPTRTLRMSQNIQF